MSKWPRPSSSSSSTIPRWVYSLSFFSNKINDKENLCLLRYFLQMNFLYRLIRFLSIHIVNSIWVISSFFLFCCQRFRPPRSLCACERVELHIVCADRVVDYQFGDISPKRIILSTVSMSPLGKLYHYVVSGFPKTLIVHTFTEKFSGNGTWTRVASASISMHSRLWQSGGWKPRKECDRVRRERETKERKRRERKRQR